MGGGDIATSPEEGVCAHVPWLCTGPELMTG